MPARLAETCGLAVLEVVVLPRGIIAALPVRPGRLREVLPVGHLAGGRLPIRPLVALRSVRGLRSGRRPHLRHLCIHLRHLRI